MICRVSFVTGWTRDYVLHNLTLPQVVRYYEYASEYQLQLARMQAVQTGLTLGLLQYKDSDNGNTDGDAITGNGVDDLIRRNKK